MYLFAQIFRTFCSQLLILPSSIQGWLLATGLPTVHSIIKSIYSLPSEIVVVEKVAQRRYYFKLVYIKSQSLFKRDTSFNLVIKSCFNFFWSTFLNFNVTHCAFDHGSFLGAYLSKGGLWIDLQDNGVRTFLKEQFFFHSPAFPSRISSKVLNVPI